MSESSDEAEFKDEDMQEQEEEEEDDNDDDDDGDEDFVEDRGDSNGDSKPKAKTMPSNGEKKSKRATPDDDDDEDESSDDDDDDDDDDLPLAALAKKKSTVKKSPAAAKKTNGSSSSATKQKTKPAAAKKAKQSASTTTTASSSSSKKYEWASAALYGTESVKGLLIQRLLCRWWYAIQWPDRASIPDKPPEHYDALDGFPGVYVCTQGAKVGHILDLRDKDKAPTFDNFVRKSSKQLQTLVVKAINEQKKILIEAEGPGTSTATELDQLLKWATKVNAEKADKEAAKILKANGLS